MAEFDFTQVGGEMSVQKQKIHVRFQKTGPRSITLVEGLDDDLDMKRIVKAMKAAFNCSCSLHTDRQGGEVIKLQGDQRENVRDWLLAQEILTEKEAAERLVMHGI
uniref:SUI1 domain-containing protein n=1 Tax=viral metagenome TaxID=1070528 RepID=A0A6C0DR31_9ZZZZ